MTAMDRPVERLSELTNSLADIVSHLNHSNTELTDALARTVLSFNDVLDRLKHIDDHSLATGLTHVGDGLQDVAEALVRAAGVVSGVAPLIALDLAVVSSHNSKNE